MSFLCAIFLLMLLSGPQRSHNEYLDVTDARLTEVFQAIKAIIQDYAFVAYVIGLEEMIVFTLTYDNREITEDEYLDPG